MLLVVFGAGAIALYLTGGALIAKDDRDDEPSEERPPVHEQPTSPTQENVEMVGTHKGEDDSNA